MGEEDVLGEDVLEEMEEGADELVLELLSEVAAALSSCRWPPTPLLRHCCPHHC